MYCSPTGVFNKMATDEKTWEYLFKLGHSRTYKAGEIIYLKKEHDVGLVCLKKGVIKNCIYLPDGKEKIICIFAAPSITGETSIIDGGDALCAAVTVTSAEVIHIPSEKAKEVLLTYPELNLLLLGIMTQKMRSIMFQAESVHLSISKRLARMLLNFKKSGVYTHNESEKYLTITHEILASFLGTTRPRITEYLNNLAEEGLIKTGRGKIIIIDPQGLQEYVDS